MITMSDSKITRAAAKALHQAWDWQYDEFCDHGTYAGGPNNGEPYAMCEIIAPRVVAAVEPLIRAAALRDAADAYENVPVAMSYTYEDVASGLRHLADQAEAQR